MTEITKNTKEEFVGINQLKEKHKWQLEKFENWAEEGEWINFHTSHYDWWMFPIKASSKYGYAYSVYQDEIDQLKSDKDFIKKYLRGVELLLLSWGWELYHEKFVDRFDVDQNWFNWPIRLHKCANSLEQFGFNNELSSVKKYAKYLINQGVSFEYNNKDLSEFFKN